MGSTRITILCENTAAGPMGLIGEHGFSALIERDGQRILFDTGQGMALANNASVLGTDLSTIPTLVLSHGHYDHTGGLPAALHPPRGVQIFAHPDIFVPKYAQLETAQGPRKVFIGLKYRRKYLETTLQAKFSFLREFTEIAPGVFFSGEVPRKTDFEHPDTRLKIEQNGELVPDPLWDDASLLIETDKGPVVLLGCAHAGAVNVLNHFAACTGHKSFHAVIGGTHLGFMGGPGEQLAASMQAFDQYGLELVAVSHCTGQLGAAMCWQHFQDRFAFASAGWSVEF
ncbi:MBL fold metallo-hydrolase [Desulfovermiculus halophilus]|uniref:MBL fold metallo-hydrolase n=1 Tax=Desulfovermiculus halophilus TaxID=339722 RepID=UPI0004840E49|nr:MBL fold metallo-hydrolase [Desulfovermiculus halophilus]